MGKGKAVGKPSKKNQEKKKDKVLEDKTFGLKNKNKSKKVQKFVTQMNTQLRGQGSDAAMKGAAAAKKSSKLAASKAEADMLAMLGNTYKVPGVKNGKKDKEEKAKKQAEERKKQIDEHEKDFGVPIVSLDQVFQCGSKAIVPRVCGELVHKENISAKNAQGVSYLNIKLDDGTTLKPLMVTIYHQTPSTFAPKVGCVLDVRNTLAMVRGERVALELDPKTEGQEYFIASPTLTQHVLDLKEENDELRAQGGIPIEELIEQQRAELRSENMTPVTKESFFAWKAEKAKKEAAAWETKRKAAAKKTGGKGLNVLSGRALFAYDANLFKDDEGALDVYDEVIDPHEGVDAVAPKDGAAALKAAPVAADAAGSAVVDGVTVALDEDLYAGAGADDDLDDLED